MKEILKKRQSALKKEYHRICKEGAINSDSSILYNGLSYGALRVAFEFDLREIMAEIEELDNKK
jgi:hypothetical protein